jgi:hypothetical protein
VCACVYQSREQLQATGALLWRQDDHGRCTACGEVACDTLCVAVCVFEPSQGTIAGNWSPYDNQDDRRGIAGVVGPAYGNIVRLVEVWRGLQLAAAVW